MIEIDNKIVSMDVFDVMFACDYKVCKGICCVEGDSGAPLTKGEREMLEKHLPAIRHLLAPRALEIIEEQGVSYFDEDGDEVTSIVNGQDCVFTTYDKEGNCMCAYEKAYYEGKIDWVKPISCQLYPIRLTEYTDFTAVNYHKWSVCKCALKKGRKEGTRVYQFLKGPLTRAFGEEWYAKLEIAAEEIKRAGIREE